GAPAGRLCFLPEVWYKCRMAQRSWSAAGAGAADDELLLARFEVMARIRAFEVRVGRSFRDGHIHGFVHTSIGQEAVAAGACAALGRDDLITTTHRGHGHCLA